MFHPGDWVDVSKQLAQLWIAAGEARPSSNLPSIFPCGSGVVMRGADGTATVEQFREIVGIAYTGDVALKFGLTLLWDVAALPSIRPALLPTGFGLLERWQIAVPLCDYTTLASSVGDDGDRAKTAAVIHDLRVPLYDTRLMFVRRCPEMNELIAEWWAERNGGDERLAFLRVLYRRPAFILPLPMTWTMTHGW